MLGYQKLKENNYLKTISKGREIFSPANKFSHVNSIGETAGYAFAYRDQQDEKIILQSEHNAIHVVTRPNTIVELTSSN